MTAAWRLWRTETELSSYDPSASLLYPYPYAASSMHAMENDVDLRYLVDADAVESGVENDGATVKIVKGFEMWEAR